MPAASNWQHTKSLLIDRIRRRHLALARLTGSPPDENIEAEIATRGDDAEALRALSERVDRALDAALLKR